MDADLSNRREAVLREANDNIERTAERLRAEGGSWRFLCECGRPGCSETLELTLDEYDEVSAHGFLLAGSHVDDEHGRVVARRNDLVVVEAPEAAKAARAR